MARRRSSAGWSTRTYKGPLWKYVHPGKYLKSEARKARYHMRPDRVLWRVFGTGSAKPSLKTKTTKVNAGTRQAEVQRATKKAAAKKTATKKTAAKRPDPYQVAAGIPARNRKAAAGMAKAAQPRKTVAVRKKNGQFNGRAVMDPRERAMFERAEQGHVDPQMRVRNSRTRRG